MCISLSTPVRAVACPSILGSTSASHLGRLFMTFWHRGEHRRLSLCPVSGCLPTALSLWLSFSRDFAAPVAARAQLALSPGHQDGTAAFTVCSHLVWRLCVTLEPWSHTNMLIGLALQFLGKKIISLDKRFLPLWGFWALYPNTAVVGGGGNPLSFSPSFSLHAVQWCQKVFLQLFSQLCHGVLWYYPSTTEGEAKEAG